MSFFEPYVGSATMVPGAPGWDDWTAGRCPRCRDYLGGSCAPDEKPWRGSSYRHQLTFPLSHCWLCRVRQGQFIHVECEA